MEGLAMRGNMKKGKTAIAEIIGLLFAARTYAHAAHLKTSSYSKHVALDEFYTCIVDIADNIAETAQGKYGKLDIPMIAVKGDVDSPAAVLEDYLHQIKKLDKACDNRALNAIVDNVEIQFSTTIYKLKELS